MVEVAWRREVKRRFTLPPGGLVANLVWQQI
ncbi:hypothetical protein E2C01_055788 [Portunus trituberculatus]|uniref:Uncharacterized protein n=1 Tax=Portunus trituberculatus TaxID=210409 RepID=A0A5B7GWH2_PORTR|nr:hypothetical protein [Portunus trituberculatus]